MSCYSCASHMHNECANITAGICCCKNEAPVAELLEEEDERPKRKVRNKGKRDSNLTDQQSTGRKRAARMYPLDKTAPCEWKGLAKAGGHGKPIVGCINGLQQARHHGPDKNTLNNEKDNVHRICHKCHNRWHTENDTGYEWGSSYAPHDKETKASNEELFAAEMMWANRKVKKVTDG